MRSLAPLNCAMVPPAYTACPASADMPNGFRSTIIRASVISCFMRSSTLQLEVRHHLRRESLPVRELQCVAGGIPPHRFAKLLRRSVRWVLEHPTMNCVRYAAAPRKVPRRCCIPISQVGAHAAYAFEERRCAMELKPHHAGVLRMLGANPGLSPAGTE